MRKYDVVEKHDGYTIGRKFYPTEDPRLGRNVNHDSRSRAYAVQAKDVSTLKSVKHKRMIPILQQGRLGSCTGNAGTGALGTAPGGVHVAEAVVKSLWSEGKKVLSETDAVADEQFAINLYAEATQIDPFGGAYPPTDTGSDGLSIAKVLKNRKQISGYLHAFTMEAFLTALADGPVIAGIAWHSGMFNPDTDGHVRITGPTVGGHEIVFDELDVENKRVWFTNSWGPEWGVDGRGYFTWPEFEALLKERGDITAFVPIEEPAPTPQPVPPQPEPTPVDPDEKAKLQAILNELRAIVKDVEQVVDDL